ncbi:MAG: nucleotidyltransferase domain-containing protein [Cyanobacteria bacterium K_DeepCast_35m_m2_023]|nr:nucleotidyltransferase domain-containing protein [Cyanobacteria bacterium K_DeepCast_35m_m2_023]
MILYSCGEVFGYGSLARGDGSWDSDTDILVVMPFEGRHLAKIREMRRLCPVRFSLDLLIRRPDEVCQALLILLAMGALLSQFNQAASGRA